MRPITSIDGFVYMILYPDQYLLTTMHLAKKQIVHLKNIDLFQIHLLSEIDSLHAIRIIPIDPTTKSFLSSAVQFVILSIIAWG